MLKVNLFFILSVLISSFTASADQADPCKEGVLNCLNKLILQQKESESKLSELETKLRNIEAKNKKLSADLVIEKSKSNNYLKNTSIIIGNYQESKRGSDKRVSFKHLLKSKSNRGYSIAWKNFKGLPHQFKNGERYSVWVYGVQHDKKNYESQNSLHVNKFLGRSFQVDGNANRQKVLLGRNHREGAVSGYLSYMFIAVRNN